MHHEASTWAAHNTVRIVVTALGAAPDECGPSGEPGYLAMSNQLKPSTICRVVSLR